MVAKKYKYFLLILLTVSSLFGQDTVDFKFNLIEKNLPFGLKEFVPLEYPKVAVVLSGGGSKGIAHIGLLKALEENNVKFEYIVGTSMGSIIGGLYSSGYSINEIDSIFTSADWQEFFSLEKTERNDLFIDQKITEDKAIFALRLDGLSPVLPNSINTGQKATNFLTLISLNAPIHVKANFDELLYKYRAVSTNLINGDKVILDKGTLSRAMRASSSISFLLPPIKIDSLTLVDGGLVENLPVFTAKELGAEFIITNNTTSKLRNKNELNYPWEIADQLVSIPIQINNRKQLENSDIVIDPDLDSIDSFEFSNVEFIINKGYSAALKSIKKIKNNIFEKYKNNFDDPDKYFKNILPFKNDLLAKSVLENFNFQDSISYKELQIFLYELKTNGNYKNFEAKLVYLNNNYHLKIERKTNPIVEKIVVSGVSLFDRNEISNCFFGLFKKPYNQRILLKSLIRAINIYRKAGYSLAEIKATKYNSRTKTLSIEFAEGIISELTVSGIEKSNEGIITREFDLKKNDYFKQDKIAEGLKNLRTTNLFDDIDLSIKTINDTTKLNLKIKERASSLIRFGLRIDNEYFTQFFTDIREENLMGTGTELGSIISIGARNRNVIIEHKSNRIFDSYITYKLRGYFDLLDINAYENSANNDDNQFSRTKVGEYRQSKLGLSFALGAQVKKFGNVFVEGKLEKNEIKNLNEQPVNPLNSNISSIRFGMRIDSQNKYPYPTEGVIINSYYETAQKILGTDIAYTKFYTDYKSYFPLAHKHTLSTAFTIGFADETMPISQHFSFGGQNNFLGFREFDFRGRQIFKTSVEYRFDLPTKIFFDTYIKLRYDLGSIWSQKEQIRFKDFRHGLGLTISFDTPIGPADFSAGKSFIFKNSLKNNSISWGKTLFYFTIGYYY